LRPGIGWEESRPCCEEKVGQQSGGQDVLLNGFSEKSVESVNDLSKKKKKKNTNITYDIGRAE
jgi:hypothetical protein